MWVRFGEEVQRNERVLTFRSGRGICSLYRRSDAGRMGSPPEPSAAGPVGRGGARERREGCPCLGVRNRADFATTMLPRRAKSPRTLFVTWQSGPMGHRPLPTSRNWIRFRNDGRIKLCLLLGACLFGKKPIQFEPETTKALRGREGFSTWMNFAEVRIMWPTRSCCGR